MIEDIVGNNGTRFIIAAGAVALGLLCLVGVLWFIRNRPSSPFIRGGKNRQPRLAVLDAAAIDTRRRLVLVRRDDVEHLIMIGGPTDVVIESRIASPAQPVLPAQAQPVQQTIPASTPSVSTNVLPERAVARPAVERRVIPQAEAKSPPVSAMGQVLYGDGSTGSTAATPRAVQPSQVVSQPDATPVLRQPERQVAVQAQPRPQPVASTIVAPPVPVETPKTPEDILDDARSRVLAANQATVAQRPIPQQNPFPSTGNSQPIVPPAQSRQEPVSKEPSATEFERILDAEITGDLGKLTADPGREQRQVAQGAGLRQEPRLEAPVPSGKTEPSLEDEMNRMLCEIAVNRKN